MTCTDPLYTASLISAILEDLLHLNLIAHTERKELMDRYVRMFVYGENVYEKV